MPIQDYKCEAGQSVTLECAVSAVPDVNDVFWEVVDTNGQYVALDMYTERYKGSSVNMPSLTIQNTNVSDSGTYRCCASNDVGPSQGSTVSLQISGGMH